MDKVRQPKYIPLILYHKFLDITNFRSKGRKKELLEIFSGNFFVEIFSRRESQNFFFPETGVLKCHEFYIFFVTCSLGATASLSRN